MLCDIVYLLLDYISDGCAFRLALTDSINNNIIMNSDWMVRTRKLEVFTLYKSMKVLKTVCNECHKGFVISKSLHVCEKCMFESGNYHERVDVIQARNIIRELNKGFTIKQRKFNNLKYYVYKKQRWYLKSDVHKIARETMKCH